MTKLHSARSSILSTALAVGLLASVPSASGGDFGDFLRDAWEEIQSRYFSDNESSADELQDEVTNSAAASGVEIQDPEQYAEYSRKLSKTLARLSPDQQERVFQQAL